MGALSWKRDLRLTIVLRPTKFFISGACVSARCQTQSEGGLQELARTDRGDGAEKKVHAWISIRVRDLTPHLPHHRREFYIHPAGAETAGTTQTFAPLIVPPLSRRPVSTPVYLHV